MHGRLPCGQEDQRADTHYRTVTVAHCAGMSTGLDGRQCIQARFLTVIIGSAAAACAPFVRNECAVSVHDTPVQVAILFSEVCSCDGSTFKSKPCTRLCDWLFLVTILIGISLPLATRW